MYLIMYRRLRNSCRDDFLVSSAAANEIVTFVAVLEEAELLCTVVSETGTTVIISPQLPMQMK
jgi:hypothetical protein